MRGSNETERSGGGESEEIKEGRGAKERKEEDVKAGGTTISDSQHC